MRGDDKSSQPQASAKRRSPEVCYSRPDSIWPCRPRILPAGRTCSGRTASFRIAGTGSGRLPHSTTRSSRRRIPADCPKPDAERACGQKPIPTTAVVLALAELGLGWATETDGGRDADDEEDTEEELDEDEQPDTGE